MFTQHKRSTVRSRPRFEILEDRRLLALDPSGIEQEFMQLSNRFRADPAGEFSRMMISASPTKARDPQVDSAMQFFGLNGVVLQSELQALTAQPPLAWSESIYNAARAHNSLMLQANQQSHQLPGEPVLRDRLQSAGFVGGFIGENVYGYGQSAIHSFAAYVADWGAGANGMQDGRGHRVNLMRPQFNRAGMAITNGPGSGDGQNVGPLLNTQDFGELRGASPMVVGAIFQDRNSSSWYEAGEGIAAVQLTFEGVAGTFSTSSMTAGGYQLELPAGSYRAIATGGGLRAPVVVPNVQIGNANVWLNIIYDPNVIPLDRFESNDSTSAATAVAAVDQSIVLVNINTPGDLDYFRLIPNATGSMRAELQHSSALGNLDLRLLNSAGGVVASSITSADVETVVFNVTRGETYYALVQSSANATSPAYQLKVDFPEPLSPVAMRDFGTVETNTAFVDIPVLANDSDPDGTIAGAQVSILASGAGTFTVVGGVVRYSAPVGYSGIDRASYKITDDQNLASAPAEIQVFVIDFSRQRPFQNSRNVSDASDDGFVSAIDALLVITEINSRSARQLPTNLADAAGLFGFLDSSGDGFLTALDALLVINLINTRTAAEGEIDLDESAALESRTSLWNRAHLAAEEPQIFSAYLAEFAEFEPLQTRVLNVLNSLPEHVQRDFLDDPRFRVTLEKFVPGKGWSLWMASPGQIGCGSRCVVLRPNLAWRSEAFAHYVIAHEFAHAFLRNGSWGDISDVEESADALAASWGFVRPSPENA